MRPTSLASALMAALVTTATAGQAQAMSVREFLRLAEGLPQNASAVLRPQGRRLVSEVTGAVATLKAEQAAALRDGRPPAHCIPASGTGITARALILRFRALPPADQDQEVIDALRQWMGERHPCRS